MKFNLSMNVFLKSIIKQFSAWKSRHVGNSFIQTHLQMTGCREEYWQVDLFNAHNIILIFKHLSNIIQILIIIVFIIFDLVLHSYSLCWELN